MNTATQSPHRIIIAGRHTVVCQGLSMFLSLHPEFSVAGTASSFAEVRHLTDVHRPRLVLMEDSLTDMRGIEASGHLHRDHPEVALALLTIIDRVSYTAAALLTGVAGTIPVSSDAGTMIDALRHMTSGRLYLAQLPAGALIEQLKLHDLFGSLSEHERSALLHMANPAQSPPAKTDASQAIALPLSDGMRQALTVLQPS